MLVAALLDEDEPADAEPTAFGRSSQPEAIAHAAIKNMESRTPLAFFLAFFLVIFLAIPLILFVIPTELLN